MSPSVAEAGPRYTRRPFPAYRHRPGETPHPHRDPAGHSYDRLEVAVPAWEPADWRALGDYLYGIDLFNHGYYWEAHETWEGLWHAAPRDSRQYRFLQGLIQLGAALLKAGMGGRHLPGARKLATRSAKLLEAVRVDDEACMGLQLDPLLAAMRTHFAPLLAGAGEPAGVAPRLRVAIKTKCL